MPRPTLLALFVLLAAAAAASFASASPSCAPSLERALGRGVARTAEEADEALASMSRAELLRAASALVREACGGGEEEAAAAVETEAPPAPRPAPPRLTPDEQADWEALSSLYNRTGGPRWFTSDGWEASTPSRVCSSANATDWEGITCENGRVVRVSLTDKNLHGDVAALASLWMDAVREVDFSNNNLVGELTGNWSGFPALETLALGQNPAISGTVPTAWTGLSAGLRALGFDRLALSGTLPAAFMGLPSAAVLALGHNHLSGTIHSNWTGLASLQQLRLESNPISGAFPAAYQGLPRLRVLGLDNTTVSGTLPRRLPAVEVISIRRTAVSGDLHGTDFSAVESLNAGRTRISGTLEPFLWKGVENLAVLDLLETRVSGTLPARWPPSRLTFLGVAPGLTGEVPNQFFGLDNLATLAVPSNELSGVIGDWKFPRLEKLQLDSNLFSGAIPAFENCPSLQHVFMASNKFTAVLSLGALSKLLTLDLSDNRISSVTLGPAPLRSIQELNLAGNALSGTLPAGLFSNGTAPSLQTVDLSGNDLSSFGEAFEPAANGLPVRLETVRLSGNRLSGRGELLSSFCAAPAGGLRVLELDSNRLSSTVPACLSGSSLRLLDLTDNALEAVEDGFLYPPGGVSRLKYLRLGSNLFDNEVLLLGQFDLHPLAFRELTSLVLSGNTEIRSDAGVLYARLAYAFPVLGRLEISNCSLTGEIFLVTGSLRALIISDNSDFHGFNVASVLSSLTTLDVSHTAYAEDGAASDAVSFKRRGVDSSDCVPSAYLKSRTLLELDIRDPNPHGTRLLLSSCRHRVREALLEDAAGAVVVFADSGLQCPRWRLATTGGAVSADADFVRYERCRCADGFAWAWDDFEGGTGACSVSCVGRADVRCDPYVVAPHHCLRGSVYPLTAPDGDLLAASARVLACRREGLCNTKSAECVSAQFDNATAFPHSDMSVRAAAPDFRCAAGHDASSLLCSRCAADLWPSGAACVPCRASFVWLVPAALLAVLAAGGTLLWRKSGRADSGFRTLSIALFWFQVTAVLETSSQVSAGNSGTSTWPWLASVRAWLETWAVLEPWAAQCVFGRGYGFLASSCVVVASPFGVAALGAAARWAARGAAARRRVSYCARFVLLSLLLPVCTRALQLFNCEEQAGVRYLSAAPYVVCDGGGALPRASGLTLARTLGAVSLVAYAAPLVAWSAWSVWRARDSVGAPGGSMHARLLQVVDGDRPAAAAEDHAMARALFLSELRQQSRLWWWPVAGVLGRTLGLALLVGLADADSVVLPVGIFFVLSASAVAHSYAVPWRHEIDNALETFVLVAATAAYLLNIVGGSASLRRSPSDRSQSGLRALVSLLHAAVLLVLCAAFWARSRKRQ